MLTRSRADRLAILDDWRRSGVSSHEFARYCGVSHSTLHKWRRDLRPEFVRVMPSPGDAAERSPQPAGASIEILLPRGASIRVAAGFDPDTLRRVFETLS